ncbi:MAG: hypothetical protein R3D00_18135 [Bacteroidia bacterium]
MTNNTEKVASQSPLKILLLEKNSSTSVLHLLEKTAFPVKVIVAGEKYEFLSHLIHTYPDMILLKDEIAGFPIREAFFLVRETHPSVPVYGIRGGNVVISEAPGPGMPSDINWLSIQNLQGQIGQLYKKRTPAPPDHLANARTRVVRQIKSNISGLENIRAFLLANESGTNQWMEEVSREIERSIAYLSRLKENLNTNPQMEVKL